MAAYGKFAFKIAAW